MLISALYNLYGNLCNIADLNTGNRFKCLVFLNRNLLLSQKLLTLKYTCLSL